MIEAPQFGGFSGIVSGNAGVLLVTVMVRWSPGSHAGLDSANRRAS